MSGRVADRDDGIQDSAGTLGQGSDSVRQEGSAEGAARSDVSRREKLEAWYHLTANLSYPLMIVLSTLLMPAMIIRFYQGWFQMLYIDLPLFMASTFSISSFYLVSQKELFPKIWLRTFLYLPPLMALGIGLTITNTKAVLEAIVGKQTAFARTPKYRVVSKQDKTVAAKKYRKRLGWVPYIELADRHVLRPHRVVRHRPTRTTSRCPS